MALEWLHWVHCLKRKNLPSQFFFYPCTISYFHGNVWNNWCNFTWCIVQAAVLSIVEGQVWEPCPPPPSAWPFLNRIHKTKKQMQQTNVTNKQTKLTNIQTNKQTNEAGILLNHQLDSTLTKLIFFPVLQCLVTHMPLHICPLPCLRLCHAWAFAMPEGLKTMERGGMRSEGMLCHKRVSAGHIGGVGQARWNSKKVSGFYNGPAYITVRPTQSSSKLLQIHLSFWNIFCWIFFRLVLWNSKPVMSQTISL